MTSVVQFRLVDAFASGPFTGNPAGVVLDADGLEPAQMQQIAREINASETAFIFGTNDLHRTPRIRWFTPGVEVGFCGHATLAAAHALHEAAGLHWTPARPGADFTFESSAGLLKLSLERLDGADFLLWWMQMPDPGLRPDNTNPMHTCELLGLTIDDLDPGAPPMRTRDDDVILIIKSWQRLYETRPRMDELARWSERHRIRGFCLSTLNTLDDSTNVASRFFAPAAGVPEDPVTGSVHGPLCAMLVAQQLVPMKGNRTALTCVQSQAGGRSGLIRALVESTPAGYRVSIAGRCFTTLRGELTAPAK
ncbi:MAG: PhzF family phenazine biosynthesis protein [Phycisphaerae bacterium]